MGGYRNTVAEQKTLDRLELDEPARDITNLVWRFGNSQGEDYFGGVFLRDANRAL